MVTQNDIIALHKLKPEYTAGQLASELGCRVQQVFATKQRRSLKIPKSKKRSVSANNLFALGRAARRKGLTVDIIQRLQLVMAP